MDIDNSKDEVKSRITRMQIFTKIVGTTEFKALARDVSQLLRFNGEALTKSNKLTHQEVHMLFIALSSAIAANNMAQLFEASMDRDVDMFIDFFKDYIFFTYQQARGIIAAKGSLSKEEMDDLAAEMMGSPERPN